MARDSNLKFVIAAAGISATANGAAIDTEGGFRADVRFFLGAITGAWAVKVQASIDNGTTYFDVCIFPALLPADSNDIIARPLYIPRPKKAENPTKVRLVYTETTSGKIIFSSALIEPMISVAVLDMDEDLSEGLAYLT